MGLISRVSSRTYRLYKKNPKFSKKYQKMDGGGFTPGEQGDARVKGVNPICAKWIQSMRESNNLPLSHGPQKVSALNTYVGAFVKLAEDVVTHYTIDLKDPTSDIINRADLGMEVMHERNAHNFPLDLAAGEVLPV